MKYIPPEPSPYESGFTAEFMYYTVDRLVRQHCTPEEIEAFRQDKGIESGKKLDENPAIKQELKELVDSYFFTDLEGTLPGFESLFDIEGNGVEDYLAKLRETYESSTEAFESLIIAFGHFAKRKNHYMEQHRKLEDLGPDPAIRTTAHDTFGHLVAPYVTLFEMVMEDVGISQSNPQS